MLRRFLRQSIGQSWWLLLLLVPLQSQAELASLVVDAGTGKVLHAQTADRRLAPASLTKMMTVHLLLNAVAVGRVSLKTEFTVSANASSTPPGKLGLRAGSTIDVETLVLAMIVRSANDAAVVAAEGLAGTEAEFAALMTRVARNMGLRSTTFRNATGLPAPDQFTTARDMAALALHIRRKHPKYYAYFRRTQFSYNGRKYGTHNNFVLGFSGAEGLKTGFTCRAGYNLVAAANRGGRRLVGVVMGGKTPGARDHRMKSLMSAAYQGKLKSDALHMANLGGAEGQGGELPPNTKTIAKLCVDGPSAERYFAAKQWGVELGLEGDRRAAVRAAKQVMRSHRGPARGGRPWLLPFVARSVIYRFGITNLKQDGATQICRALRREAAHCLVVSPQAASAKMRQAKLAKNSAQPSTPPTPTPPNQ